MRVIMLAIFAVSIGGLANAGDIASDGIPDITSMARAFNHYSLMPLEPRERGDECALDYVSSETSREPLKLRYFDEFSVDGNGKFLRMFNGDGRQIDFIITDIRGKSQAEVTDTAAKYLRNMLRYCKQMELAKNMISSGISLTGSEDAMNLLQANTILTEMHQPYAALKFAIEIRKKGPIQAKNDRDVRSFNDVWGKMIDKITAEIRRQW